MKKSYQSRRAEALILQAKFDQSITRLQHIVKRYKFAVLSEQRRYVEEIGRAA